MCFTLFVHTPPLHDYAYLTNICGTDKGMEAGIYR